MIWTPEKIEQLELLWNTGNSASEIARILKTTRSTALGKLYRMGLLGDMSDEERGRRVSLGLRASHIRRSFLRRKALRNARP